MSLDLAEFRRLDKLAGGGSGGAGGSGTVTSVAISGSDGIEVDSGSPVSTTGTIALGINATTLKTHLSLGNVNNTSDANKPISTATQTALDTKLTLGGILLTKLASTSNQTITAGYGAYIPYYHEIGATYTTEIGSGSVLEIG